MNKIYIWAIVASIVCIGSAVSVKEFVYGEPPQRILISEVGAHEKNGLEWIEIANVSTSSISLEDWKFFENETAHGLQLVQGMSTLHANNVALIVQNSDTFLLQYPSTTVSVFDSSWGSLKMTGEELALVNETGDRVDNIFYTTSTGFSVERIGFGRHDWKEHVSSSSMGTFSFATTSETSLVSTTTTELMIDDKAIIPTTSIMIPENSIVVTTTIATSTLFTTSSSSVIPVAASGQPEYVYVSEFVSDPYTDKKEWVELFFSGTVTTSIEGWSLHDSKGEFLSLEGVLAPGEYRVFELQHSVLNNSGDTVSLVTAAGTVQGKVVFGKDEIIGIPPRGWSVALYRNEYTITAVATPGEKNIIIANTQTNSVISKKNKKNKTPTGKKIAIGALRISEIYSNPDDKTEEFIELENISEDDIILDGVSIKDGSGAETTVEGIIKSGGYMSISSIKGNLNNSGDRIILMQEEQVLADVIYGVWNGVVSQQSAPKKGESLSYNEAEQAYVITQIPTKGERNYFEMATVEVGGTIPESYEEEPVVEQITSVEKPLTQAELWITEIYPNPTGSDSAEFIEIYNPTDTRISLEGYAIDDGEGGSAPHAFAPVDTIGAGEYKAVIRSATGIALNNDVDFARLLFQNEQIASVGYRDAKEGSSYAKFGDSWEWTMRPTPAEQNIVAPLIPTHKTSTAAVPVEVTIGDAKKMDDNAYVQVEGVVSALPGTIDTRTLVIQSVQGSLEGIEIYKHDKQFPIFHLGDKIQVVGRISTTKNGNRINIQSNEHISLQQAGKDPVKETSIAGLADMFSHQRVRLVGTIEYASAQKILLINDTKEVALVLAAKAQGVSLQAGSEVEVTGLYIKKEEDVVYVSEPADFVVLQTAIAAPEKIKQTRSVLPILISVVVLIILLIRYVCIKKSITKKEKM